ncbi:MAG: hypothetical protein DRJ60_02175 [Thermoprotei archaeon]|nr:MAG: hypothetical protein DRJ60_02175 [Thermoprotei archaeon]
MTLISIVVPFNKGMEDLKPLIDSIMANIDICNDILKKVDNNALEVILVSERKLPLPTDVPLKINFFLLTCGKISVGAARNIGVRKAKGSFIYFVDSDCIIPNNTFKTMISHIVSIKDDPTIAGVGGPVIGITTNSTFEKYYNCGLFSPFPTMMKRVELNYLKLTLCHHPVTANLLLKKEIFNNYEFIDGVGEDLDLVLRVLRDGKKIIYSPNLVVYHRHRKTLKDFLKHFSRLATYYPEFVKKHKLNPVMIRRLIVVAPYIIFMYFLILNTPLFLIPLIGILIHYYYKTKSIKYSISFFLLDLLIQFAVVPCAVTKEVIRSLWRKMTKRH